MKISIILPYYNRKQLFENTLRSINYYLRGNIELIVIDDGSNEEHRISGDFNLIRLEKTGWRGACIAYNTGFHAASGDIILINSSECIHLGDIIGYLLKNFTSDSYICFSAYMASEKISFNDFEWEYRPESRILTMLSPMNYWWGVHSLIKNMIPYCAAISKENMNILGGYDDRFQYGIGYDDYDFIHRVKNLKLRTETVDYPFVIHQWHKPTDYPNTRNLDLLNELNLKYPNRIRANVAS